MAGRTKHIVFLSRPPSLVNASHCVVSDAAIRMGSIVPLSLNIRLPFHESCFHIHKWSSQHSEYGISIGNNTSSEVQTGHSWSAREWCLEYYEHCSLNKDSQSKGLDLVSYWSSGYTTHLGVPYFAPLHWSLKLVDPSILFCLKNTLFSW